MTEEANSVSHTEASGKIHYQGDNQPLLYLTHLRSI
jgi:hypothetical protein